MAINLQDHNYLDFAQTVFLEFLVNHSEERENFQWKLIEQIIIL